jgi:hypothetical protein
LSRPIWRSQEFDFTNEVSDPDDRLDHAQLFLGEPDLSSMPIHDQTCICSRMKAEPLSMLIESIVARQNASATAGTSSRLMLSIVIVRETSTTSFQCRSASRSLI